MKNKMVAARSRKAKRKQGKTAERQAPKRVLRPPETIRSREPSFSMGMSVACMHVFIRTPDACWPATGSRVFHRVAGGGGGVGVAVDDVATRSLLTKRVSSRNDSSAELVKYID